MGVGMREVIDAVKSSLLTVVSTGGFSDRDKGFGDSLVEQVRTRGSLSPSQAFYALNLLHRSYKERLQKAGKTLPAIGSIPDPKATNRAKQAAVVPQKKFISVQAKGESSVVDKRIRICLEGSSDSVEADMVTAIPEIRFDEKLNCWIAPTSSAVYVQKHLPHVKHDPVVGAIIRKQKLLATLGRAPSLDSVIETLREYGVESDAKFNVQLNDGAALRQFQVCGLYQMTRNGGRVILSDEQGLGKTITSIAYMQLMKHSRPALVVCKSTIKTNWSREIDKFMIDNKTVHIIRGQSNYELPDANIYIINYDILRFWSEYLSGIGIQIAVADECHMIRNPDSAAYKSFKKIADGVPHVIMSTGTPMENGPTDLWTFLNIVAPHAWESRKTFEDRYTKKKNIKVVKKYKDKFGRDRERTFEVPKIQGAMNLQELYDRASPYLIRRMMKDVESEIPPKIRSTIVLEMSDEYKKKYADALEELYAEIDALGEDERPNHFKIMHKTTQIAAEAKIDQIVDWVDDFTRHGEKIILFTKNVSILEAYLERLPGFLRIDGSVSPEKRQPIIDRLKADPKIRGIVANIDAAAEGYNVNEVSAIIASQLDYRPTRHEQGEARGRRIGKKDTLMCVYFLAENTIEENIMSILGKKLEMIDAALNGQESELKFSTEDVGREVLSKLIAQRRAMKRRQLAAAQSAT